MWNVRATKGDHKWEVTFYRIHHAPRHSERAWWEAKNWDFTTYAQLLILFAIANFLLTLFYIHVIFTVSVCSTIPLNFMGTANFRVPQFCAMPSQLWGITQNWGHRNLFLVFADSALQNADGKTSQPVLIWTPASSSAIADKPRDAFVQYPVAQLT